MMPTNICCSSIIMFYLVETTIPINEHTTIVFAGRAVSILAPGDVSPGHIMLAPLKINLIAPLSTCTLGKRSGTAMHGVRHNIACVENVLYF